MATTNQLTGGGFQDALGNPLANGYLEMELSQDAVTSDNTQVTAGHTIHISLDASGNVVTNPVQSVWPNDVLNPSDTFYNVSAYSAQGQLVWGPNAQQVLSSPSPFDIGTWVPAVVNIADNSDGILLQTNGVNNGSQTRLDLQEGSGIALSDNGSGVITITSDSAGIDLQTNSVNNTDQTKLNLVNGTNVSVTSDSSGNVTIGVSSTAPSGPAGGNLSGTYPNPTVAKVNGVSVSGHPINTSDVIVGTSTTASAWRQLTQDDILPGFAIDSFSGGSVVEIGATVTNPSFTASYSSLPVSANITNTDGIDSPLTLTSPFTNGTVVGSFNKTSATSTTFTLTAIAATTQTSQQTIAWEPRSFGGLGAAGATSVTASGNNATLNNGAVLTDNGLSDSNVGETYGPYSASSQKVYLLLIGGSHTFKDSNTGFAFAFNSPTSISFVNQNGSTVAMFLYESTNLLTGSFGVLVNS